MHDSEHGVDGEEHHHDRAEESRNASRSTALRGEQENEDDDGRRQHVCGEIGVELLQAFKSGKDGNRWRDHRVAGKQGGSGDTEQKGDRRPLPERALRQRLQGQDAAFALVVGQHQEQHIFRGDDDQQRPDYERDDADDLGRPQRGALELAERGLKGVERARADVAEHDADRAEREHPELSRRMGQVALCAINWRRDGVLRNGLGHSLSGPRGRRLPPGRQKRRVSILSHPRNGKGWRFLVPLTLSNPFWRRQSHAKREAPVKRRRACTCSAINPATIFGFSTFGK